MPAAKTKTTKSEPTYKEAMEELEAIVAKVDDRGVDIDELAGNIKRAHELISICQARIEAVRFEVENVMSGKDEPIQKEQNNKVDMNNDEESQDELF